MLLRGDQLAGNGLGLFGGFGILIAVADERLDSHVAAVHDQVGNGVIAGLHGELCVGLDPAHGACHGISGFAGLTFCVQKRMGSAAEFLMGLLAGNEILAKRIIFYAVEYVVDGTDCHFDTGIAFAEQLIGILVHMKTSRIKKYNHMMCDFGKNMWKQKDEKAVSEEEKMCYTDKKDQEGLLWFVMSSCGNSAREKRRI